MVATVLSFALAIGKNQPLKKEIPKWKSDVPLTEGQLRSKRDEFWDTAPAYGGKLFCFLDHRQY